MSLSIPVIAPPEGVREGNENLVRLTADAGGKVASLIAREQQGNYLRIAITGGGCNGLSYKLKFTPEPRKGDILVRTAGVPVVVDPKTAFTSRARSSTTRPRWSPAASSSRIPMPKPVVPVARASAYEGWAHRVSSRLK